MLYLVFVFLKTNGQIIQVEGYQMQVISF